MESNNLRYERKFRIENVRVFDIESLFLIHPMGFRKAYPDRQINNIYFDTADLKCYRENVAGVSDREKYRIRWYSDIKQILKPVFEIKYKRNALGGKKSTPMNSFLMKDCAHALKSLGRRLDIPPALVPLLLNSYQRKYYESPDKKFRLTLDWDVKYSSLLMSHSFRGYQYEDPTCIIELKYEQEFDSEAQEVTQFFPFRQTKNSKYVTGVFSTNAN